MEKYWKSRQELTKLKERKVEVDDEIHLETIQLAIYITIFMGLLVISPVIITIILIFIELKG